MPGPKPKLNFTTSLNQWTCTISNVFHRLGKDKEEAQRQFDFLLAEASEGVSACPEIVFKDLADLFLDHVLEQHSPERYRHCKERLQEFKDHVGERMKARDLRPSHVDAWLKTKGTLTPGTERLYKSILLACLNWGARSKDKDGGGILLENPLRAKVKLPKGGSRGKEALWTPEVYAQVLRVASPAFCDLVRILAWTGARPSTVIRIEARHYNKRQSRWDCEDLYQGRSGTKYVRHVRLLNQEARDLVERLNAEHPEGPIFRNSFGEPWDPDAPQIYLTNLRTKFKETKKLTWPKKLMVYGLRHTFAHQFLQEHPNEIEYLRVLLGHKDYQMILAHYGHMIDLDAHAFKRMEGFKTFK